MKKISSQPCNKTKHHSQYEGKTKKKSEYESKVLDNDKKINHSRERAKAGKHSTAFSIAATDFKNQKKEANPNPCLLPTS